MNSSAEAHFVRRADASAKLHSFTGERPAANMARAFHIVGMIWLKTFLHDNPYATTLARQPLRNNPYATTRTRQPVRDNPCTTTLSRQPLRDNPYATTIARQPLPDNQWSGAPSFALFAKGGISRMCGGRVSGEEQWYPTLRKQREGWGTRSFFVVQRKDQVGVRDRDRRLTILLWNHW